MKPMNRNRLALCVALAGATSNQAADAQRRPTERTLAEFRHALDSLRQRTLIPGLSAAIAFDDTLIWSEGFGYADLDQRIRATAHTPYEVASLSKPVGAILLLRLVEAGKLRLDDPIAKYSSDWKSDSVLIRHVFTMTSSAVPGTHYEYDGDKFATLFDPIVKASGRRYREIISNDILIPLGMTETAPGNDLRAGQLAMDELLGKENAARYDSVVARMAQSYRVDSAGTIKASKESMFGLSPANGIVSTVLDYAKFDAAVDQHRLLSPATTQMMWTPPRAPDGQPFPYAFGWFVQQYDNEKVIWHNGLLPDRYSALYLKLPDAKLSLFLLANSDALSMPFRLAAGDVSHSAFACAFITIVGPYDNRGAGPLCRARADSLITEWRHAHHLQ